jgi:succinate dehydrogenase / fumarate reductase cytochrome b subunit
LRHPRFKRPLDARDVPCNQHLRSARCNNKVMTTVNDKRPVNLDLRTIKQPVPAIASITHRITGILIFLGLPILLWMLDRSLASPESFDSLKNILAMPLVSLIIWGLLAVLIFHLVAGVRHLLMDMGIGESLESGRLGAKAVFAVSVVLILLAGGWIW